MSLPATAAKPYSLDAPGVLALRTLMWYYWYVAREASQYKATWGWGEVPIGAIWCPPGSNPSENVGGDGRTGAGSLPVEMVWWLGAP